MPRNFCSRKHPKQLSSKKIISLLVVFLLFCASFVSGFIVRGDNDLLNSLGFSHLIAGSAPNPGQTASGNTYDSVAARIAEIEGILSRDSLDSFSVDKASALVIGSFTQSVEDPYLKYLDPIQYQSFLSDPSSDYTGVGILFGERKGICFAADVFDGSDAQALGVEAGDVLVAIDGERKDYAYTELVSRLNQPAGTKITLTWKRPSKVESEANKEFSTTLTCSALKAENLESWIDNKVGYIKLRQLTQNSDELVKSALEDLQEKGAQSFVLDIRDNPGGYLTQAINIASFFIKGGAVVQIKTADGISTKNTNGETLSDAPLVLLVNNNTAGAAEVVASALQDNKRALLVGATTQGKGSVQLIKPLSFGGALRYTAAQYLTPLGHEINNNGVVPQEQVVQKKDSDTQLRIALSSARWLAQG